MSAVRRAGVLAVLSVAALVGCESPGGPSGDSLYDLGPLPAALDIRWPELPVTERVIEVSTAAEFEAAAAQPGTLVRVIAGFPERVNVTASDIDVEVVDGVRLGSLLIERELGRVRVRGGTWTGLETGLPASFLGGSPEWRAEWRVHDVTFDDVTVESPDSAFLIRGQRIAILRSRVTAARYSVWCGATGSFQNEDIIVAGNEMSSAGDEATVRLVQVLRSVTVDNRLQNGMKHNWRVHGRSDLAFGGRNTLIDTGVMLGTLPDDAVARVWFEDNVVHQTAPSLLIIDDALGMLELRRNVAYTDVTTCWICGGNPAWVDEDNRLEPYQPAP